MNNREQEVLSQAKKNIKLTRAKELEDITLIKSLQLSNLATGLIVSNFKV